ASLEWDKNDIEMPRGKVLEKCREKRYEVLLKLCEENGIDLLLTGHNLDDDISTMFYRSAHQSGLDGYASMKSTSGFPVSHSSTKFLGHPLLQIPKARLIETCKAAGLVWNEDPSNQDLERRRNGALAALHDLQMT